MANNTPDVSSYLSESPFIAILRGVKPDEVLPHAQVIVEAGWRCIEVPLNSPNPLESIARLAQHYGRDILIGAGTVTNADDVPTIAEAGGRLIVAPNTDPAVIAAARENNMVVMPGFVTPTEAFAAYNAGAQYLKLFPADIFGPNYIKALRAVLPQDSFIVPVGGVRPDNLGDFRAAGSAAFGIGSAVYKAGMNPAETGKLAESFTTAWKL